MMVSVDHAETDDSDESVEPDLHTKINYFYRSHFIHNCELTSDELDNIASKLRSEGNLVQRIDSFYGPWSGQFNFYEEQIADIIQKGMVESRCQNAADTYAMRLAPEDISLVNQLLKSQITILVIHVLSYFRCLA